MFNIYSPGQEGSSIAPVEKNDRYDHNDQARAAHEIGDRECVHQIMPVTFMVRTPLNPVDHNTNAETLSNEDGRSTST